MTDGWGLALSETAWEELYSHLFPGDGDEHGAVLGVNVVPTPEGAQLLVREVYLAQDGVDYVPGERGYRMLTASFVRDRAVDCRDSGLGYLAVHCHGGTDSVGFSRDDLASHERGYPALLDVVGGALVGGLVFARGAVAGDLWLPDGRRVELSHLRVVGHPSRTLYRAPLTAPIADPSYDRQARLFGDRGQHRLGTQKVGVIGTGGAGSLIVEYLARLGVGHLVVADPERIELSNLPRVVGSSRWDARTWLTGTGRPPWLQRLGARLTVHKVHIARRVARQANPNITFEAIVGSILDQDVAERFVDCDYLFLAADSMSARLVVNAIVQQYLIPASEVGAKVRVDPNTGDIVDVFSIVRPLNPGGGCLWCNELISPQKLQEEALSPTERAAQRYVEDADVVAPSVITMNAVAVSHAVDDYLFSILELADSDAALQWRRFLPRKGEVEFHTPRVDPSCSECGADVGRLGAGSTRRLPTRHARTHRGRFRRLQAVVRDQFPLRH